MNFDFSEEQLLLRETVARWCAGRHGLDTAKRREARRHPGGFDRAAWRELAELGVLALPFAAEAGGLGGGPVEIFAVAEPLGAGLATEPFTESLVMAGTLLEAAGEGPGRAALARVIAGEAVPAAALGERAGRYNLHHVETRARADGGGWRLSGAKSAVWQGGAADLLVVSARVSGDARDAGGLGLFLVEADAAERRPWVAADGSLAAEVAFRDTPATFLECDATDALETALDRTWLAASAEMLGVASMLFEQTLAYVKTRVQFGQPIGRFQAIQHRMVDCYAALEQGRSMVCRAAAKGDTAAIAAARAYLAEAAIAIAHEAVQFHGGMGVTDELIIGHGLKRIQMLARLHGDQGVAAARYAEAA
ncbi:acyl-CoA dehydrogenase family protein [Thermaurantiacus tibetensis]|uniref:acyl-CoA dehydrogenase family protein n=1 Tax=Thermaurantiacus tibetensis TaxID=2759035 RepID=UPI00188FBB88|nr:acyl-CoA dehydrogenase family protein [Thermaurantiacus tibetensis]